MSNDGRIEASDSSASTHSILEQFRARFRDELEKGKLFERMIAQFLRTDPQYANLLDAVWMWSEWPGRWRADNTGIDPVTRERDTGNFWAIQCKFYDSTTPIKKEHVSSFLADSGKQFEIDGQQKTFAYRLIVSTTEKWGHNAGAVTEQQAVPVGTLYLNELADSPVDWSAFRIDEPQPMVLRSKKKLREHQEDVSLAHRILLGPRDAALHQDWGTAYERGDLPESLFALESETGCRFQPGALHKCKTRRLCLRAKQGKGLNTPAGMRSVCPTTRRA